MKDPAPPIPALTREQMLAVDRAMAEDYGVEPIQLMEIAGGQCARLLRTRLLGDDPRGKQVTVLAGTGGNGGDALVAARRLHAWGAQVGVALTREPGAFQGLPAQHLTALSHLGIALVGADEIAQLRPADAVLDGVLGFSLSGPPRGAAAALIDWANNQEAPVLAVDLPSGLEASSGLIHAPTVVATATLTLALPKRGLLAPAAAPYVGELYLADIGVPPELYAGLGLQVGPLFARDEIIRLP